MFNSYKEVSKNLIKEIKEFFNVSNIKELTLEEINDYCSQYSQDKVSKYVVIAEVDNKTIKQEFFSFKDALVASDRITNYDEGSDANIIISQDNQVVKFYMNRQWSFPKTSIYQ